MDTSSSHLHNNPLRQNSYYYFPFEKKGLRHGEVVEHPQGHSVPSGRVSFSSRQRGSRDSAHTHAHTGPYGSGLDLSHRSFRGRTVQLPRSQEWGFAEAAPPTPSRALRKSQPCPLNATHAELCHNRTSLCSQQQVQQQLGCGTEVPARWG